ncbi:MAG: hypothetical protein BAJALOKI1v1_880004 [Promethearchaeota archaeon]|nr:MAG: hypothetical protein BAJALOKI1v1_880004 [Candidatus Lokiarchaeota archaeon]
MTDPIDIKDLESFIDGLRQSFDCLEELETDGLKGMQAKLAKAISQLREKKLDKIPPIPKFLGVVTKEDLKNFFLEQLNYLKEVLESSEYSENDKFKLVMKMTKLREKVNKFY